MASRTLNTTFYIDNIAVTRVLAVREDRRLGRPPELWVTVQMPLAAAPMDLVGHTGTLFVQRGADVHRRFSGLIESATVLGSAQLGGTGVHHCRFHIVSTLSLLEHIVDSQIFQELEVSDIVTQIMEQHGIASAALDWRLVGTYPKREYCVQYNESVLAFVTRLLEKEGIYYYVEFTDEGEKIVFMDDSTTADELAGESNRLPFRQSTGQDMGFDVITSVDEQHRTVSGKFVLRDYDFTHPDLDLTSEAETDLDVDLERYDYPGAYSEPSEGARYAQILLEAEQVERRTLVVDADCSRLVPGMKVVVEEALNDAINGKYLVIGATHELTAEYSEDQAEREAGHDVGAKHEGHRTRARLLPAAVKYRLPALTPVPVVEGPQTARVVGPTGAEPENIHTDEWGRCKVKFHWDLSEHQDDKASCWMRVKQLQSSGSMALPRLDWEVVVEFLGGDPDRPIVTGRLYNGIFMPPYALPEGKSRTALRSATTPGGGGSNEVRFEDKAGGEEIFINAQYDMTVNAANNKDKGIGNSDAKNVACDSSLTVGVNDSTQVTMGDTTSIGGDQTVAVGANRSVEVNALQALKVAGNSGVEVSGNHFEMDGDPLEALVNLAVEKATEVAQAKAEEMLGEVDAYVQGKVDQVMAPVTAMQEQAERVAGAMDAVSNGELGEVSTALREAAALPQAAELGGQMRDAMGAGVQAGGEQLGVEMQAPEAAGEGEEQGLSQQIGLDQVANGLIENGMRAGGDVANAALHDVFGEALGLDGSGGGGSSMANAAGPELDLAGIDETDREKGPGHSLSLLEGTLDEKVAAIKAILAVNGVNTEVAGSMTQTVGIGRAELVLGDRVETVDGNKDETCVGLIVLSKGDVSETVSGSKTCMVGGAIVDLIKGNHTVEASAPATLIGALHKITAKEKITFKCGGSEVVIEGGGITFKAPIVAVMSPKIQVTKKVAEL